LPGSARVQVAGYQRDIRRQRALGLISFRLLRRVHALVPSHPAVCGRNGHRFKPAVFVADIAVVSRFQGYVSLAAVRLGLAFECSYLRSIDCPDLDCRGSCRFDGDDRRIHLEYRTAALNHHPGCAIVQTDLSELAVGVAVERLKRCDSASPQPNDAAVVKLDLGSASIRSLYLRSLLQRSVDAGRRPLLLRIRSPVNVAGNIREPRHPHRTVVGGIGLL
jgi:hypothetical protein